MQRAVVGGIDSNGVALAAAATVTLAAAVQGFLSAARSTAKTACMEVVTDLEADHLRWRPLLGMTVEFDGGSKLFILQHQLRKAGG